MAIHPSHAERILMGEKTVEFRRTRLRAGVEQVIIYATAPSKSLLGTFEVQDVDEGTPAEMWTRYQKQGGIDARAFQSYFASAQRAFAVKVGRVVRLRQPARLSDLGRGLSVPQSFYYVGANLLGGLLRSQGGWPARS
jgi:predicted transcriptional regulator